MYLSYARLSVQYYITNVSKREYAHVSLLNASHSYGKSLEFTTGELVDLSAQHIVQLQQITHLLLVVQFELRV